jgi:hypothetical protein
MIILCMYKTQKNYSFIVAICQTSPDNWAFEYFDMYIFNLPAWAPCLIIQLQFYLDA